MQNEIVLANARIVLPDEVIEGHLVVRAGRIAEIGTGPAKGEDLGCDLVIPGLVELHTDHIESHYFPRPKVVWDKHAAIQAHDAQVAASGITTVLDAIRVGTDETAKMAAEDMHELGLAIAGAVAEGRTRADHYIHLRCEVSAGDVVEGFEKIATNPRLRLVSLMDHAPGQRQFVNLDAYRIYYQKKLALSDEDFAAFSAKRLEDSAAYAPASRRAIAAACRERGIAIASHDDANDEHVAEAVSLGTAIAEFPTTMDAARASRAAGLHVLMGAPNIVRGGSHSGNIAATDLIAEGLLDVLSSDYVPFSMLQATFKLAADETMTLPEAVRMVTRTPAQAAGFDDRGEIAIGKRADLVRVATHDRLPPVVRGVWREGNRVA